MSTKKHFQLGLQYIISLEPRGVKAKIADCSKVERGNFYNMVSGKRPIPEEKRNRIAKCMGLSERDLERMGMDIEEGKDDSIHVKKTLAKKIILPEMESLPDLDIFAVDPETLESHHVGEAWTINDSSIMAQFDKEPTYQARYLFKPKLKNFLDES